MSWIKVKPSQIRPTISRHLRFLLDGGFASDDSPSRTISALPQSRSWAQLWLATIALLVAWQAVEVSSRYSAYLNSPAWIVPYVAWSFLFTLVAGSSARRAAEGFSTLLAVQLLVRVLGPLWLAIVLTALALGPFVSSLPAGEYFRDQDTWAYLLNLVAWPRLRLPGVFEFSNFSAMVNETLWSAPWLVLTGGLAAATVRLAKGLWIAMVVILGAAALCVWLAISATASGELPNTYLALGLTGVIGGQVAILAGKLRVTRANYVMFGVLAACAVVAIIGVRWRSADPFLQPLIGLLAAIGAVAGAEMRWGWRGLAIAVSPYGLPALAIAFPIQQIVSDVAPRQSPIVNFLASIPIIGLLAFLLVFASRLAIGTMTALPVAPLPRYELPEFRRFFARDRRAVPTAAFFLAFALVVIAILAATLFALQRNPWQN